MAHDLVVRGGTVIDGTGAQPVTADVAIDGDTITHVGEVTDTGTREIDATGLTVTPGFIDLHTHLDAQIGWDPLMTPSTYHGVTTALLGNCGVTFAPCKPADRRMLAEWMESVEDIPADAIEGGLPWDWEGYGGYLTALEGLRPAVNTTGLVGHSAVRLYVMGENAIDGQPTAKEIAQMAEVVGQSVADGAVGFSTSRFLAHVVPDGRCVPGTFATADEIGAIAQAISDAGGGLFQNVLNVSEMESELELLKLEGSFPGVRVLFSTGTGMSAQSGRWMRDQVARINDEGIDLNGVSIPRPSGGVVGLSGLSPWRGQAWKALSALPLSERLATIRNPQRRAELITEAEAKGTRLPADRIHWLGAPGDTPSYTAGPEGSLAAMAEAAGESHSETYLRVADESDGMAMFTMRVFNPNIEALADLFESEHVLPSLGDAGAHVGQIMDAGFSTFVLSYWHRERGLFSAEQAVQKLTSDPARILGLEQGTLAAGRPADVNVFDMDTVNECVPEMVHDFPGGHARFVQKSTGYTASICNGTVITEDGQHTGDRAGRVLRS